MSQPQPRVKSACDECGVVDDLGRHHVTIFDPEALPDGLRAESRHFRCCADRGCPDGTCDQILAQGRVA